METQTASAGRKRQAQGDYPVSAIRQKKSGGWKDFATTQMNEMARKHNEEAKVTGKISAEVKHPKRKKQGRNVQAGPPV